MQKYAAYMEEQKLKKTQASTAQNRKTVSGEVDQLKTKKLKLETDNESLLAAADDYAEKA